MNIWLILAVLLAFFSEKLSKVARINQYVTEARAAYSRQDYHTAIYLYHYLNDSLRVRDREVKLNLAHAYFQQKNNSQAVKFYQPLLPKAPARISSVIYLQLGVIEAPEDKTRALDYFKKALILNPANEDARYNYELLKKYLLLHPEESQRIPADPEQQRNKPNKLAEKEETPNSGKKEDSQGSAQSEMPDNTTADSANPPTAGSNPNNPDEAAAESSTQNAGHEATPNSGTRKESNGLLSGTKRGLRPDDAAANNQNQTGQGSRQAREEQDKNSQTTFERLQEVNITPEKARMLLEAMREAEVQYLQQIPRKSSGKSNAGKPNW